MINYNCRLLYNMQLYVKIYLFIYLKYSEQNRKNHRERLRRWLEERTRKRRYVVLFSSWSTEAPNMCKITDSSHPLLEAACGPLNIQ